MMNGMRRATDSEVLSLLRAMIREGNRPLIERRAMEWAVEVISQHSKSVPSDAERRLRELARIVDMAEGFDGRFGSETAAEHEMGAISEAFVAARKEGCDAYTSLCRALDVGSEAP